MVANHLIEIYTLLFGWSMYESIWDILVGTGLAFIPFFVALLQMFVQSRDPLQSVKGAQSTLEFKLIGMMIVLILLVIPWKGGGGTTISDFRYEIATPFCAGTEQLGHASSGAADATGTSNDSSFGTTMAGYQVHPPIGWSVVMIASSAITNASIASISCVNNYNFLLMRIANIKIPSGEVRDRIKNFTDTCYQPALAQYNINSQNVTVPLGTSIIDQPNWIGSTLFLDTPDQYYQRDGANMVFENSQYNFTNNVVLRPHDAIDPSVVKPTCKQVWEGDGSLPIGSTDARINQSLLETIYDSVPDDDIGNVRDDWETWGSTMFGTLTLSQQKNVFVQMMLTADSVETPKRNIVYGANGFSDEGFLNESFTDAAVDLINIPERIGQATQARLITIVAPYVAMFVQMMIVIAAPFVLAGNNYSFSAFFGLALAWFGIEFVNFIWATISWFETHMFTMFVDFNEPDSFWGSTKYFFQAGEYAGSQIEANLLSTLPSYLAVILPATWLMLVGLMGSKMAGAMGLAGAIGGAGGAGLQTGRTASSMVASAAGGPVKGAAANAAKGVASGASKVGKGIAGAFKGK